MLVISKIIGLFVELVNFLLVARNCETQIKIVSQHMGRGKKNITLCPLGGCATLKRPRKGALRANRSRCRAALRAGLSHWPRVGPSADFAPQRMLSGCASQVLWCGFRGYAAGPADS